MILYFFSSLTFGIFLDVFISFVIIDIPFLFDIASPNIYLVFYWVCPSLSNEPFRLLISTKELSLKLFSDYAASIHSLDSSWLKEYFDWCFEQIFPITSLAKWFHDCWVFFPEFEMIYFGVYEFGRDDSTIVNILSK